MTNLSMRRMAAANDDDGAEDGEQRKHRDHQRGVGNVETVYHRREARLADYSDRQRFEDNIHRVVEPSMRFAQTPC